MIFGNARAKRERRQLAALAREPMTPLEHRTWPVGTFAALRVHEGLPPGDPELETCRHGYTNNRYRVLVTYQHGDWGTVQHLWIERHDGERPHCWADLQWIKDRVAGPDRIAIEVYPPAGAVVDELNMYHLWVLPAGFKLPFGLQPKDRGDVAALIEVQP